MSLRPVTGTVWTLRCDECGRTASVRGTLAFSAYASAAGHGWSTGGRRDLCPGCARAAAPARTSARRRR